MVLRVAVVGLGKIARDQHIPAIAATEGVELAAIASRNASLPDVPSFPDLETLLREGPTVDAVALCTPPQGRHAQATAVLQAGKHLLLEKPPGATVAELVPLIAAASAVKRTLFATWHSRFAAGVEPARAFLAQRAIRAVRIDWKEDVRVWHPGQRWIWQPGGFGVFDPGINALSILTRVLPGTVFLTESEFSFPENRAAPIAANLRFSGGGFEVRAEFDWRQTGPQTWDLVAETDAGAMVLSGGGKKLAVDGRVLAEGENREYVGIYRRLRELTERGESDVDLSPLVHVADAFLLARRVVVEPFMESP